MKFTFQIYWEKKAGEHDVTPMLLPLTLKLSSIEEAREIVGKIVGHENMPAHSVTITPEGSGVPERWFQLDGKWRRKDA